MKRRIIGVLVILFGLSLLLLGTGARVLERVPLPWEVWGRSEVFEHEHYRFSGVSTVVIRNPVGHVHVIGEDSSEITVRATRYVRGHDRGRNRKLLDRVELSAEVKADRLHLEAAAPLLTNHEGLSVTYHLRVPHGQAVDIEAAIGKVKLEDLHGPVLVKTDVGSISAANLRGPSGQLLTRLGSITVTDAAVTGAFVLKSSVGSIRYSGTPGEETEAATELGSITIDAHGSDRAYELRAHTEMGTIRSRLPVDGTQSERLLEGTIGSGGAPDGRIDCRTSMGSITLR